jgi:ABC-type transporter Mla MlaB component
MRSRHVNQSDNAERIDRRTGTVTVLATGVGARLVLTGEVDVSMNSQLYAAAAELEKLGMPIEVHTRDVTYTDSSVMAILARLAHRCEHRIKVVDPPPLVRFLLLVAQLEDAVDVVSRRPAPKQLGDEVGRELLRRPDERCSCAACRAEPGQAADKVPASS